MPPSSSLGFFGQSQERSVSLVRKLRLLESVLPIFLVAASHAWNLNLPYTAERRFWTKFISPCLLIGEAGWRFGKLDDRHGLLVDQLLKGLEMSIVEVDDFTEESKAAKYPRLETLRDYIGHASTGTEDLLIGRIRKPQDQNLSSKLLSTLNQLSQILEDKSPPPPPEEATVTSRSKPLVSPQLLNLFSTIASYFQCQCPKPHQAILLLFTHRKLPANDGPHSFTLLLSRRKPSKQWQETTISVKEKVPKSRVTIRLPGEEEQSNVPSKVVKDLCKIIDGSSGCRLELDVNGESLYQIAPSDLKTKDLEDVESISLAEGLFWTDQQGFNRQTKTCMALVLSYALLDFCGEPWFPEGWNKNGIFFLQCGKHLRLRPILVAHLRRTPKHSKPAKVSPDRKLLYHSILLMEIFKQEPLGLKFDPTESVEKLRKLIRRQFDAINWGESERYSLSVEACIDGDESEKLEKPPEDPEAHFVSFYFTRVIDRLEADFTTLWGADSDPDEVISTLTGKRVPQKGMLPPIPKQKPINLKGIPLFRKPPPPSTPKPRIPALMKDQQIKFFDSSDKPEPKQVDGATGWFDKADKDIDMLPERPPLTEKRVKIAILDTGINLDNTLISTKKGRIQCWPSKQECKDTDGHGTHVAYLLLRLTKHTELRIARINSSQSFAATKVKTLTEKIVKTHGSRHATFFVHGEAIDHFSIEDRVDIINLSFGFETFHEDLRPILEAIRTARNNGVITFAAAGNEGGNNGPCWPASQSDDVIRINSTDAKGNASSFNTNSQDKMCICTLGEGVPSCEKDAEGKWVHRNGTSFATPIAISVASIVLGIVDDLVREVEMEKNTKTQADRKMPVPATFVKMMKRLRTKTGIESVLSKACVLRRKESAMGYSYVAPWFFFEIEEANRASVIFTLLQDVWE